MSAHGLPGPQPDLQVDVLLCCPNKITARGLKMHPYVPVGTLLPRDCSLHLLSRKNCWHRRPVTVETGLRADGKQNGNSLPLSQRGGKEDVKTCLLLYPTHSLEAREQHSWGKLLPCSDGMLLFPLSPERQDPS